MSTVAAISTALNNSGIGIVRVSGPEAIEIADRVFIAHSGKKLGECKSHTIHYGHIVDADQTIDEVLVMLMKAPHTYTTEDTVEINCHGGVYVVKKVLETVCKYGAALAEPGEFTRKAFLGGRIDLSQAEAVMDLIHAQNEYAREASVRQLRGNLSEKIKKIRGDIIYHIAYIESALDDPEHISLDGYHEKICPELIEWKEKILKMIHSFENGRRMTEGIKTVIAGKPNAGKSSLLNMLAGEERAIVTEIAGTTRDVLEEQVNINGISLRLLDTAGIHQTEDIVESIGVQRALDHLEDADLVLYVADQTSGLDQDDRDILEHIQGKNCICLINKMDIESEQNLTQQISDILCRDYHILEIIPFSAKTGIGLEKLTEKISDIFFTGKVSFNDQIYITNVRHKDLLQKSLESINLVETSIENGYPEDFYSIDLMDAYTSLGLIIGEEVEDDLVNEIFHRFCMGK